MEFTVFNRINTVLVVFLFSLSAFGLGNQNTTIKVSPNPFSKELHLNDLPVGAKTIVLENEYGQVVQAYFIMENDFTIDEDLKPGIYMLKIDVNDELFVYRVTKK